MQASTPFQAFAETQTAHLPRNHLKLLPISAMNRSN
jgi:hypothetical protein